MSDEHDRRTRLVAQFAQQVEDLGLHGDVEGGGRLVGDDELRSERQGHGDDDALLLPARELVRVVVEAAFGVGDSDLSHGLDDARLEIGLAGLLIVGAQTFGDLPPDRKDRVECGRRLLEDHRHISAAHGPQLIGGDAEHVLPGDDDGAGALCRLGQQSEDGPGGHGLAGSRLTHDRQHLTG